jgi:Skp family chaperone for outer membrane proteins
MLQFRWGVLAMLAVVALTPLVCSAVKDTAAAGNTAVAVGVIDTDKIYNDYQGALDAQGLFKAFVDKAQLPITELQAGAGLSEDDLNKYIHLKEAAVPDKDAIDKLEKQAKDTYDAFVVLDNRIKNAPDKVTADDKAQYEKLTSLVNVAKTRLNTLEPQVTKTIEDEMRRYQDILHDQVYSAIGKVAKDNQLTLVINKSVPLSTQGATAPIVLWNDDKVSITDKVVKYLNDNYKSDIFKQQSK